MVADLRRRFGSRPEEMLQMLLKLCEGGVEFSRVAKEIRRLTLFGPWIAFKVCDMLERVEGAPINFDHAAVFMFKDPMRACDLLFRQRQGLEPNVKLKMEFIVEPIVQYLREEFKGQMAPPLYDRPVDLQEIETVLCKWKSMMNGHYGPYNDINEIRAGVELWREHCEVARSFLHFMPAGGNSWIV